MVKPLVDATYQEHVLTSVTRLDYGYEVGHGNGWCFVIRDVDNPDKITPKVGDTVLFYGKGFGYSVLGVQIEDNLLYFTKWSDHRRETMIRLAYSKIENLKKYIKLMDEIKDEEEFETVDISGFGGSYERGCQLMLRAGYRWLQEHPNFTFTVDEIPGIFGLASIKTSETNEEALTADEVERAVLGKELDKVISDSVDGEATGAMHHAVIAHLARILEHGWYGWVRGSKEREMRSYTYPCGLPMP